MIRHSVMFKVAPNKSYEEIVSIFNTIPMNVEGIIYWQLRLNDKDKGSGADHWDIQLIADFKSWEDLYRYENHQYHKKMVDLLMPMLSSRAICDFEFDDTSVGGKFGVMRMG